MTVKEFAERAEISVKLAYELIAQGGIQHRRMGLKGNRGTIRITEEDFLAYMESTKIVVTKPYRTVRR